jgi:hypothetical protein
MVDLNGEGKSGAGKCPKANKMARKYLEAVWEMGTDNWEIAEAIAEENELKKIDEEEEKRKKRKAELLAKREARLSGGLLPAGDTQAEE